MPSIHAFPPLSAADASVLVLGTMPGKESLRLGQYYANPRNAFWRIVCELLDIDAARPYAERVKELVAARVAVWDVLQRCTRESSLDSDIDDPVPNDFASFFAAHPRITRVYFNGGAADELFGKHVLDTLDPERLLQYARLPSTSPAHTVAYATKLASWRVIVP